MELKGLQNHMIILLLVLQILCIQECQAYSYSYPWWSMWYFWVILFGVLACCFGAGGSYYRRRMLSRAASGDRNQGPIVVTSGTYPPNPHQQPYITGYGYNQQVVGPPIQPTYPLQPPVYAEGAHQHGFNPNAADAKKDNLPPSYSELYGPGAGTPGTAPAPAST